VDPARALPEPGQANWCPPGWVENRGPRNLELNPAKAQTIPGTTQSEGNQFLEPGTNPGATCCQGFATGGEAERSPALEMLGTFWGTAGSGGLLSVEIMDKKKKL